MTPSKLVECGSGEAPPMRAFLRYCLVAAAGLAVNYSVYSLCVVLWPLAGFVVVLGTVLAGVVLAGVFLAAVLFAIADAQDSPRSGRDYLVGTPWTLPTLSGSG